MLGTFNFNKEGVFRGVSKKSKSTVVQKSNSQKKYKSAKVQKSEVKSLKNKKSKGAGKTP